MTTMTAPAGSVTGGVDTHLDLHVAAAVGHLGGVLGAETFPTNKAGYRKLLAWLCSHVPLHKVGVDAVRRELLARLWSAGAGPADALRHHRPPTDHDQPNRQQDQRWIQDKRFVGLWPF